MGRIARQGDGRDLIFPSDGSPISAEDLRRMLFITMYDPREWFDTASLLNALDARGRP
ncbi:hypothetical protein ACFQX6_17070 [Streptosporangium lutulentum]